MKVKPIEAHPQKPVSIEGAQGVSMRMLIGPDDQAPNFHMRHFAVEPGGHSPQHQHDSEHEVLILSGAGVLRADQGDQPLQKGDVVYVPPNERHQFANIGTTPLEFICLIPAPKDCAS